MDFKVSGWTESKKAACEFVWRWCENEEVARVTLRSRLEPTRWLWVLMVLGYGLLRFEYGLKKPSQQGLENWLVW